MSKTHLAIGLLALAMSGFAQEPQLRDLVGQKVTLRGRFSLWGKEAPFILVGKEPVYVVEHGSFTWGEPYSSMDKQEVTITGVLRRFEPPPAAKTDRTEQQPPPYFFFNRRDAAISLANLDAQTIAENRELDEKLLKAHELKNTDMVLALFSARDDIFFIAPNGTLNKGRAAIRQSYDQFFARLESIHAEIKSVTYLPAQDGIIAVGTVVFHRKPKGQPPDDKTVIWTDFRVKENGKWVYLFRHAHWPL